MTETKVFVLSKESYIMDKIANHFETEEDNLVIDYENNPEHKIFIDFHLNALLSSDYVIEYGNDLIFITGLDYSLAKALYGPTVCDDIQTKQVLTDLIIEAHGANGVDYDAVVELICIDEDFKSRKDIVTWISGQTTLIEQIREIQLAQAD